MRTRFRGSKSFIHRSIKHVAMTPLSPLLERVLLIVIRNSMAIRFARDIYNVTQQYVT